MQRHHLPDTPTRGSSEAEQCSHKAQVTGSSPVPAPMDPLNHRALFVGIDPGASGAIAVVNVFDQLVAVLDAPTVTTSTVSGGSRTRLDVAEAANLLRQWPGIVSVGLERVGAMPGQGVTSMFSFGEGFGMWQGILGTLGLPYELFLPLTWQKTQLGARSARGKDAAYVVASRLYPDAQLRGPRGAILDGRADAILIARHARLVSTGHGVTVPRLPLRT
jgi:crossover junction endodeoxyribonuclease RuvC